MFNIEKKDWEKTTIEEIATIKGGKRMPKGRILLETETPHPYIKVKNMHGSKIINLDKDFEFVSENDFEKISNYTVKSGDIIISIVGTIGLVSLVGETLNNANLTENCVKLINIDNFSTEYLYYYLTSEIGQYEIAKGIVGSTQPKLPIYNIKKISIPRPPLKDQKLIANILSSFDDKIETNNAIIANLEAQAQAIFKSWFVDFEPFQDGEFIDSELGMIPKGWEVGTLKDVSEDIITGKTPPTKNKTYYGSDIPFITIPDMHNKIYVITTERCLSKTGANTQPKKELPKNSIITSCIATVGLVSLVSENSHTNQQINGIVPAEGISPYYIYSFLKTQYYYLNNIGSSGSTTKNINKNMFSDIKILIPNNTILDKYNKLMQPLFEYILEIEKQNQNLAQLRDTLLPKLMSGEIRVGQESTETLENIE